MISAGNQLQQVRAILAKCDVDLIDPGFEKRKIQFYNQMRGYENSSLINEDSQSN